MNTSYVILGYFMSTQPKNLLYFLKSNIISVHAM